ncbi:uncharacterized protein LOC107035652 isoform X1 [Diachasma alloeum]|uniref:uncharacterized protein LOC107035652 isoform X1 n=1 Tax=Diachasma alloeum TaxID=454923 RepID=UPI0007382D58|nr:uncharacterized protein LOC107035652 isoform X1 [Diachasma alloeum]
MVKKKGVVWNYYNKKVDGTTVTAFCKFCHRSYIQNATRMEKHLARCEKASIDVKNLFLRVSTSKRVNRARLLGAKLPEGWTKRNEEMSQLDVSSFTEADLEDIDEWNRQKQMQEDDPTQNMAFSEDGDDDGGWDGRQNDIRGINHQGQARSIDPLVQIHTGMFFDVAPDDRKIQIRKSNESDHLNRAHTATSVSTFEPTINQLGVHSPLQTKILQEQLLEKRAQRKIAELELRRKALELERYQWEYERDKARSDEIWAHESRMMQLKEEREQRLVAESSYETKQ